MSAVLQCKQLGLFIIISGITIANMETIKKPVKRFKCDFCEYVATQKGSLKNHVLAIHKRVKPLQM